MTLIPQPEGKMYVFATTADSLQRESASAVFGATVSQCLGHFRMSEAWHEYICAATSGDKPMHLHNPARQPAARKRQRRLKYLDS
jgi:hypothetical protein